ncbi:S-layer homology domain-containing protein [Cohnella sp. GbtcB17]|uniref:S-layer homology domain-containing protein n=1 Tax=Cohnella sp. GbtcB17 TaxID=2824762 RepID=UPI001C2FECDF|nr:S-layer homology domain-containing protein [Cohnella sp. GbtcB17]
MVRKLIKRCTPLLLTAVLVVQPLVPAGAVETAAGPGSMESASGGESAGSGTAGWSDSLPAWASAEVEELADAGVVSGYEDGTFRPDRAVTRAEFTVMLNRLLAQLPKNGLVEGDQSQEAIFTDVKDEWFAEDVKKAARLGLVQGDATGAFRPQALLNRQETAVMLGRLTGRKAERAVEFTDSGRIPAWAAPAISALHEAGIVRGYEDGAFRGEKSLTRAEAAVALHRTLKLLKGPDQAAPLTVAVKSDEGQPLAHALVRVHAKGKRAQLAAGRTDAQGSFELPGAWESGSYDIYATSDGVAGFRSVDWMPGTPAYDLVASKAAVLEGKLTGDDGKAAGGIVLAFTTNPTYYAITRADGSFTAYVEPERTYQLSYIADESIREAAAKAGTAEPELLQTEQAKQALALLDSEAAKSDSCKCVRTDAPGSYTAPKAGAKLDLGMLRLNGGVPSGGGGGGGGGTQTPDVTPPAVPSGLRAEPGDGLIALAWTANAESDLAGYRIYGREEGTEAWTIQADAGVSVSYTAKGLTNGRTYEFAVAAYDKSGNASARSELVRAKPKAGVPPPDVTPPAVPGGVRTEAGDGKVILTWDMSSEEDLAGYRIYWRVSDGAAWSQFDKPGRESGYTITGLTNGTTYDFAVTAYDASGNESAKSQTRRETPRDDQTQDRDPPAVPSGLKAEPGVRKIELSWTANTEADLDSYRIYSRVQGSQTWSGGVDVGLDTTYTVLDVWHDRTYELAIAAYDTSGNSSHMSAIVSATPLEEEQPDTTPPAVPAGLTAGAGEGRIALNWTANGEDDLAGYRVYVRAVGASSWGAALEAGKTASYTATGLTGGIAYELAVSAYDESGNESAKSGAVQATPTGDGSNLPPDPGSVATELPASGQASFQEMTDFLYTGPNPIQTGVQPGAIEAERAGVLRGRVLDTAQAPVGGVRITVLDHPEWGQTLSRADGMFDLAVNGDGIWTLQYEKDGYMTVQRKKQATPGDYEHLEDVVLTAYDSKVTQVQLEDSTEIQAAQGTPVTDEDGTRQSTVLFPVGTTATMRLPDGTQQPLPSISFRSTEYTAGPEGPKAMPGELPPYVAYTYAVELSADEAVQAGATEVTFDREVYHYLDNFIGFPVGEAVPNAYYDREKGQWIAAPNGKVIEIVSVKNGLAGIDADGDGEADGEEQLAKLGVTEEELRKLAELYEPGKTLWRVPITHFTPYDHNWPYGPPGDAESPPDREPWEKRKKEDDPCKKKGSIIGCQNQTLGQQIPIAGTPYMLNYMSEREEGYKAKSTLEIPVSDGEPLPASLRRMNVSIQIGGKLHRASFAPSPNKTYTFEWDGKDAYGRELTGSHPYTVRVDYVYKAQYYPSNGEFERSFGRISAAPSSVYGQMRDTSEVSVGQEWHGALESPRNPYASAGVAGWSLDPHHIYDDGSKRLLLGDGTTQTKTRSMRGEVDFSFEGHTIEYGTMTTGMDGWIYYAAVNFFTRSKVILGLDPSGKVVKVADVPLSNWNVIAVDAQGTIYCYNPDKYQLLRKTKRQTDWEVIAGTGRGGPQAPLPDGAEAKNVPLPGIIELAAGMDGSVYFTSYPTRPGDQNLVPYRTTLYKIGPDGILQTLGDHTAKGKDSGPGDKAGIGAVEQIRMGSDGSLYMTDTNAATLFGDYRAFTRIRKLSPDGTLSRVAGVLLDEPGSRPAAHGMKATEAEFFFLSSYYAGGLSRLFLDAQDRLYFRAGGRDVYRVAQDGLMEKLETPSWVMDQATQKFNLTAVTADGGRVVETQNDRVGYFLVKEADSLLETPDEGGQVVYEFEAGDQTHAQTTDALTGAVLTKLDYDEEGRLVRVTDRSGNEMSIERDSAGKPLAIIGAGGQRTELTTDEQGRLVAVTSPAGETYRMTYDAGGLLQTFVDPLEQTSTYAYDEDGLLIRAENGAGGVQTLSRADTADGTIVTFTDAEGRATVYETKRIEGGVQRTTTGPDGTRLVAAVRPGSERIELPDGSVMTKTMTGDPRWDMDVPVMKEATLTQPDGKKATFNESRAVEWNEDGSLKSLTHTNKTGTSVTESKYEAATRQLTETGPDGLKQVFTYDEYGRVVQVEWPGQQLAPIVYTYDEKGRLAQSTQGEQLAKYTYDERNRLTALTDAAGRTRSFAYDEADRLISSTTPGGKVYGSSYDELGQLTGLTMPDGTTYRQSYNELGQFDGFASAEGPDWISLAHGDGGKLERSTLRGGRQIDYVYDTGGGKRIAGMNDADILRTFEYADNTDRAKKLESVGQIPGSLPQTNEFAYVGDLVSRQTITGKAKGVYDYSYDVLANLTKIQTSVTRMVYGVSQTANVTTDMRRDDMGRLVKYGPFTFDRTGPNGSVAGMNDGKLQVTQTYDELGRQKERIYTLAGREVYRIAPEYDLSGNITRLTVTTPEGTETTVYTFDLDGQLTNAQRSGPEGATAETYEYDANKNRIVREVTGSERMASSYGSHDVLTAVGGTAYSFDEDGYLRQRGADTFKYGARGELLTASVSGVTYSYAYDALGRQTYREDGAGHSTQYFYGDPTSLQLVTSTVNENGELTNYLYDEDGLLIGLERGNVRYYVITDGVGTPQQVLDVQGKVVKRLKYDSYGGVLSDSNPGFALAIGYAGGLEDRGTGLVRFGARDLDTLSGRWTARDPILFESGQANLYAYVNNNPVQYRDPCGTMCIGATAYDGIGGGGRVCINNEGFSSCLEAGFGVGGGLDIAPLEGLTADGLSVEATAKIVKGPLALTVGVKLKDRWEGGCLEVEPIGKFEAGPFKTDLFNPLEKFSVKGKEENLGKNILDLFTPSKPELALKAKGCKSYKW